MARVWSIFAKPTVHLVSRDRYLSLGQQGFITCRAGTHPQEHRGQEGSMPFLRFALMNLPQISLYILAIFLRNAEAATRGARREDTSCRRHKCAAAAAKRRVEPGGPPHTPEEGHAEPMLCVAESSSATWQLQTGSERQPGVHSMPTAGATNYNANVGALLPQRAPAAGVGGGAGVAYAEATLAQDFTISYHKNYKVLTNSAEARKYLLHQCETPAVQRPPFGHHC